MSHQPYCGFVRPQPQSQIQQIQIAEQQRINGDEARRLYLEEINTVSERNTVKNSIHKTRISPTKTKRRLSEEEITNHKLFSFAQNNDIESLREVLNYNPDKINILDDYGWSLLMIACQAGSRDCVKELLSRGIDTDIRDKAGDSARSLVIKNNNVTLATLLLEYTNIKKNKEKTNTQECRPKVKCKEQYECSVCKETFPDRREHLSSTVHNINASKGKKIPANYVIPSSNKGYQILLKGGWDRDTGLGPHGTGRKCPIKAIQKYDRRGLGHEDVKTSETNKKISDYKHFKKIQANNYRRSKNFEIDFRREFY
ncbi:G patch domain and ankyrin repeat-containing protein 1 homolog [Aricia agestis]|uniref:G patch domain and ankyrin repeat-containing protein 1 homolog n=1 Tax=Aricia agestis TaxID=91739 RepID=UPI001C20373D|nr:G patch domain and ankyrin repeat-containing protein 1 homolog [Aricia agestis]